MSIFKTHSGCDCQTLIEDVLKRQEYTTRMIVMKTEELGAKFDAALAKIQEQKATIQAKDAQIATLQEQASNPDVPSDIEQKVAALDAELNSQATAQAQAPAAQ